MAQQPKQLTPTSSPVHYVGARIRSLRERDGLSQADLGRLIVQGTDLVRKVEDGSRVPSLAFVEGCDDVSRTGGALQRLWPLIERERRLRLHRSHRDSAGAGGYQSAAPNRFVLDWLVSDGRVPKNQAPAAAANVLAELRQRDHQLGAGSIYRSVAAIIGDDLEAMSTEVPRIAVGYLELAGYEAVDLGCDDVGQSHYVHALRIATQSGDRLYGAYLIAVSLAHLALHCGDPAQALRLASAALCGIDCTATPATRAAFHTVVARAHARAGDEAQATAALLRAEAEFSLVDPDAEPDWIRYIQEADFADERAHCFFDLGHHDLVDRELGTALSRLHATRVRRLAIDTALQASSLARRGEVEKACIVGRQAVDYAAATASFRSTHRITMMMAELHPYAGMSTVADLGEYIHITLPAGPTVAVTSPG